MLNSLTETFTNLEHQPEMRAIILTAASDGAPPTETDVAEPADLIRSELRENYQERKTLYDQIEKCSMPVIAAIDGPAAGDGFELALACHLRIASPRASFRLPDVMLDSIAGRSAVQRLAREIGEAAAHEIVPNGEIILAEEALRIGLINRIAPEDGLLTEAESLARQISTMAPLAMRACLEAVTRGIELPLAEGLALETKLFSSLFATNDVREGTSAFLEKRPPVFKGT